MEDEHLGYVKIKLGDIVQDKAITKNKLSFMAEMQRTQLNNWIKGEIAYVDLHVLARLCKALDCNVQDILEYIPDDNDYKK